MAFLAIDIGNTRLKWALYPATEPHTQPIAQGAEFLSNIPSLPDNGWSGLGVKPSHMLGCCAASDAVRKQVQRLIDNKWGAHSQWIVPKEQEAGLTNGYDKPSRLGADRWVAMIGAWQHNLAADCEPTPLVVVMVGTAVTVEAIDINGTFLGGLILPGHGIMLRALETGTAGLNVPTGEVCPFPTNTSDALTSGGTYAIAGAVRRMWDSLRSHSDIPPRVLMTGGAGWKMLPHMSMPCELVENVIFDGLLHIAHQRGMQ